MTSELLPKSYRGKTKEEVTELKRSKGIISCAECRRLKLKCDKQIPCCHCKRRGCPSICPHGEFSLGYGNKHVLNDGEKLQQKLTQMSERIKHLEDTLRIAHGCHSSTPHPLLSDELLTVKQVSKESLAASKDPSSNLDDVLDALGTLTISDERIERYLGGSSTAENLLIKKDDQETLETRIRKLNIPDGYTEWFRIDGSNQVISGFSADVKQNEEILRRAIEERLPTRQRATALCEAYLENLSVFMRPFDRAQVYEELIPALYKRDERGRLTMSIDDLGLILVIFACGAIGDLTLEPLNNESAMFHRLSLSCLALRPCIDQEYVALATVQTVCLTGFYYLFTGLPYSAERTWKVKCTVGVLARAAGLHRDPSHWNFSEKIAERRRMVFWELYSTDNWQSLGTGRPPLIRADAVDCQISKDKDSYIDENGKLTPGAWSFRQHFVKAIISPLSAKLASVTSMKYSEVLEFDKKIREFKMDVDKGDNEISTISSRSGPGFEQAGSILRSIMSDIIRNSSLLHVHRAFFAEAINRNPENPIQSSFGPSFLAGYRAAATVLQLLRSRFDEISPLLFRLWPVWNFAMTSAVVIAVVVARCPSNTLAPEALSELEKAVTMFEKSIKHPVIRNSLATITTLRNNAREAFYSHPSRTGKLGQPENDRNDDAFEILRGRPRTVQPLKRGKTGSFERRNRVARYQSMDVTRRAAPLLSMTEEEEAIPTKMYAMDDWHVQGTPSSDGFSSEPYGIGQQIGEGVESRAESRAPPEPSTGAVGMLGGPQQLFGGVVGPGFESTQTTFNTNTSTPSPEHAIYGVDNSGFSNAYTMQEPAQGVYLADPPVFPEDFMNAYSQLEGRVGEVTGPVASSSGGADDTWRSLVLDSGLLGIDEFDVLQARCNTLQ